MDQRNPVEVWPIYNCHIHTFTKKHTPRQFIKWVLSDAEIGRINWWRMPVYLLGVVLYFVLLIILAKFTISLSARSDLLYVLGYPFMLLFQAVLVIPIVLLAVILIALAAILLLQGIINVLLKMRSVSQSQETDSQLTQLKNKVAQGRQRVIRSNLLFNLLVGINPASNDIFERMTRFLKIAEQPTQQDVFKQVQLQYPNAEPTKSVFVVLPMDMGFMDLGAL